MAYSERYFFSRNQLESLIKRAITEETNKWKKKYKFKVVPYWDDSLPEYFTITFSSIDTFIRFLVDEFYIEKYPFNSSIRLRSIDFRTMYEATGKSMDMGIDFCFIGKTEENRGLEKRAEYLESVVKKVALKYNCIVEVFKIQPIINLSTSDISDSGLGTIFNYKELKKKFEKRCELKNISPQDMISRLSNSSVRLDNPIRFIVKQETDIKKLASFISEVMFNLTWWAYFPFSYKSVNMHTSNTEKILYDALDGMGSFHYLIESIGNKRGIRDCYYINSKPREEKVIQILDRFVKDGEDEEF